jgi:hypothetical protein
MARAEIEFSKLSGAQSANARAAQAGLLYLDNAPVAQLASLTEQQVREDDAESFRSLGWLAEKALQQGDTAGARQYLQRAVDTIAARGAFLEPWLIALCRQTNVAPPLEPRFELEEYYTLLDQLMTEAEAHLPKPNATELH